MGNQFSIRFAEERDIGLILSFIKKIATYEKLLDEVKATEQVLHENIFIKKHAEVIIAELDSISIGFALFFYNFSTFVGRPGLYLEDIFIDKQYRGNGYGKKMLSFLANIAKEKNCGRMEWVVLDWNEPSINFYKSLGARAMSEWTIYRIGENQFNNLIQAK